MAKGDDADAIRAALVAAEERQEAHLERTAAGRGEAAGEGDIGPSAGPSAGSGGEDEDGEAAATVCPVPRCRPPVAFVRSARSRRWRTPPLMPSRRRTTAGARPKKKGKKAAGGPILSFGDDD